jgi:hypothetical protein
MQEEGKFPWSPRKRMRPRRAVAGAMRLRREGRAMGDLGGMITEEEKVVGRGKGRDES